MTTLTGRQVLALALAAGFSRRHANVMTAVAWYESRWNPNNVGDTTIRKGYESRGLWQIWQGAWPTKSFGYSNDSELFDPAKNAHAAHVVFRVQGYEAWSAYNSYHNTTAFKALVTKIAAINLAPAPAPTPAPVTHTPAIIDVAAEHKAAAEVGHPPFNVTNRCLVVVRGFFSLPADGKSPTAAAGWTGTHYKHPGDANPPAGVPVWWTGGSHGDGHVAFSIGGGRIISSDIGGADTISIAKLTDVHARWGLTYAGWSEDIESHRVYTPGA